MDPARRRFLGLAGAAVAVGAAAVTGWDLIGDDPGGARRAVAPSTSATAATAEPSLRVTNDTAPPLPIPDNLPNPNAPDTLGPLGSIAIPRLGLDAPLQDGISLAAIDQGPGWWPGTALPGQLGNLVVAGHRTTFTQPFRHLERLRAGDLVQFRIAGVTSTYATRGVVVVPADAVDIAAQSYAHTATLFACHPPGQATQRIVAKLRLLDPAGAPVDPEVDLPPLVGGSQSGGHVLTVRVDP